MNELSPALLAPYVLRAGVPGAGGRSTPAAIEGAAQEFEAQFIYQMLRQMRASMSLDGEDSGFGAETMGATLDIELARVLSAQGGIGLSALLAKAVAGQGSTERRVEDATAASETRSAPSNLTELFAAPVSSAYGWRTDPFSGAQKFHHGVDIAMAYGVEVPAVEAGRVVSAGEEGRYGNTVVLEHPSGTRTRYAHLSEINVQPGQAVAAGETLGRAGRSGAATGPHLHFEVIVDSQRLNPLSEAARASLEEHP